MSKESFKMFIKGKPDLLKQVSNGKQSFQSLYEVYSIYGENPSVWDKYILEDEKPISTSIDGINFSKIIKSIQSIDMETLQNGITNLEKAVDILKTFTKKEPEIKPNSYTPRQVHRRFED